MKRIVAVRFFAFAPSIILLTVSICPEVDLLVLKPFLFVHNIMSTACLIIFSNIRLYIFAAMNVKVMPR